MHRHQGCQYPLPQVTNLGALHIEKAASAYSERREVERQAISIPPTIHTCTQNLKKHLPHKGRSTRSIFQSLDVTLSMVPSL